MRSPNQTLNRLRHPNVLPFSASWRCYPGNLGLRDSDAGYHGLGARETSVPGEHLLRGGAMRQLLILLVLAIVLSACARASTRMLDANTAIISGKGSAFDDHASVVQAAKSGLARFDGKWHGVARSNQPVRCGNGLCVELCFRMGSVRGKVTSIGK